MTRRRLLRVGGLAAGGSLLPGCATTATRRMTAGARCLPPVEVARNRVIREVVGLRPYRASGFVVRAEALGDKRLVHNYGHGGAGITLSWGTSRLATHLGLPGHRGAVAVIGAGIMGLTTARLVQEAGFPVTVYAAAPPPDTTSNIAGGQWAPFGHFRQAAVTPAWRDQYRAALDHSWRRFQLLVGDEYGVRWLPTYSEGDGPDADDPLERYRPGHRLLAAGEHPFALERVSRYETMYVETGRFLRQLIRDVLLAGGRMERRAFATPAEVAALPERIVFNCTGLGARTLFGDAELKPVRGQLAVLPPQPEVAYAFTGRAGYMFPRPDGVLLGGTFDMDEWSTEPDPATTERIVRSHRALLGALPCGPGATV